jgi:hypothetical protein
MSLFRWAIVAMIAGVAGSSEAAPKTVPPTAIAKVEPQHEAEPRVEIGPAVLYVFDETGRVIAVE